MACSASALNASVADDDEEEDQDEDTGGESTEEPAPKPEKKAKKSKKGVKKVKKSKKDKKAAKPSKKADKASDKNVVRLKDLAKQAGIGEASARKKLRDADVPRGEGRWSWELGTKALKSARKALGLE